MKNKVNFLWKGFRLCALIAFVSLIAFSMASCDDGSSGGSGKATLIIENLSSTAGEIITDVYWKNTDTGRSQDEKNVKIPIQGNKSFSLDEGTYYIEVYTNNDDGDYINDLHLYAGSTVTLVWTTYLRKR